MFNFFRRGALSIAAIAMTAGTVFADGWTLDESASKLAFGSIKFNDLGEVHSFKSIDGNVDSEGKVTLGVDLASVETLIDIRNERMIEHVFKNVARASISAQIDLSALEATPVGESTLLETEGTLNLLGVEVPLDAELFILRVSEDRVLVTTDSMIFLSTADAEIDAGVDKLQELASLDIIARAVPVTLRLMFDANDTSG